MEHIKENEVKIYSISANSAAALAARYAELSRRLAAGDDLCGLFDTGKFTNDSHRMAFAASGRTEVIESLKTFRAAAVKGQKLIFAMPGQGSSGPVPIEYLCASMPTFREYIERAQERLTGGGAPSVKEILSRGKARSSMEEQLFIFIYGTAMAMQYCEWGAKPDMVIAHSLGELAAMVVCGMASYEEMLGFVQRRAQIIDALAGAGAMVHVAADIRDTCRVAASYGGKLSVAAVNSRGSAVISGEIKALTAFERELDRLSLPHKRLRVPKAAHSAMMEPALTPIAALDFPSVRDGVYPLYSSVTGAMLSAREAETPAWRVRHCRGTARFDLALAALSAGLGGNGAVAVEFGVHRVLAAAAIKAMPRVKWYGASTMARYHDGRSPEYCFKRGILETLAALWECGRLPRVQSFPHAIYK
ncbi:acyltransferase domain-containing protein [Cloacibacillus evryensis]|uniref:acyltransferase domain-containing protein n=1 Tax=Cloacibacillus evryensis TaxID=508460 RepID=UPI0026715C9D|nr:acyltransferase domain-containing protein [Cloacibacillus evryensis]